MQITYSMPITVRQGRSNGRAYKMEQEFTIKQMEKILGIDKIKPIQLTPSDEADTKEDAEYFKDWYEQDLRELFRGNGK